MIQIQPRDNIPPFLPIIVSVLAAIISLICAIIPLWLAGVNPLVTFDAMFDGVFGSFFAFSEMLTRATPLIFTGLAVTVAFRARLWNIGAEGQYLGALAAVLFGTGWLDLPSFLLIPLLVCVGAIAGAYWHGGAHLSQNALWRR